MYHLMGGTFFLSGKNKERKEKMKPILLSSGKKVELAVTAGSVKLVHNLLKIDLMSIDSKGGSTLQELVENPISLCDVLFVLCKKNCDEQKITDIEFGEGMDGNCIADATSAFTEELVNFFPLHRRTLLMQSLKTMEEMQNKIAILGVEKMTKMKPLMEEMIQKEMNSNLTLESLVSMSSEQKLN